MQIYDLLCGCKSFSTAYDELELDTLGDKRQHYGFNSVMKFHLYGTSASGIEVSEYAPGLWGLRCARDIFAT